MTWVSQYGLFNCTFMQLATNCMGKCVHPNTVVKLKTKTFYTCLSGSPGHMRQNAYSHNLKWTFEDLLLCYCYAIKTKSTTIGKHVSQPASAGKEANCALELSVSGSSRSDFALMSLAFLSPVLPTCLVVSVQKSDFHLINMFCVVIVVKKLLCLTQVVFFYFVLHNSKLPLVVTTKVTHLGSRLFRQPDGVNCVVRRVYFAGCPKTE